jgi:hypothetical protein
VTDRPHPEPEHDERARETAAAARIRQQEQWVDLQIRQAVERGDFDGLPGYGKPIEGLGTEHDPDWWLKQLVEREQIHVLPPALAIRKDDAELHDVLDRLATEAQVRREVTDFNERVRRALYGTTGWPPVVTPQRDVDVEVQAWRTRRDERVAARRAAEPPRKPPRRRWRRRR